MPATQTISVRYHRDGAGCHRRSGDERAQEYANKRIEDAHRNGNAQGIVDEGTKQVLLHIAHGCLRNGNGCHHSVQASTDEGNVRCLDRHVSAGTDSQPHISL